MCLKNANSHLIAALVTIFIEALVLVVLIVNVDKKSVVSAENEIDTSTLTDEMLTDIELLLEQNFRMQSATSSSSHFARGEGISVSGTTDDLQINSENTIAAVENDSVYQQHQPNAYSNDSVYQQHQPHAYSTTLDSNLVKLLDSINKTIFDTTLQTPITERAPAIATTDTVSSTNRLTEKERIEYYRKNFRLIRNFRIVYPYALKTRDLVSELNEKLATAGSPLEMKKLINSYEDMLFAEYEQAVRKMTVSQGRLLLKLIARETNKTGYELIREFKGAFSATFWYSIGRIFGTNLKETYDKKNDDKLIEEVLEKHKKNEL